MELPDIGKNCNLSSCNRLDFLPVKCDACSGIYCIEHYLYDAHRCEKSQAKNFQVPVCPLCSKPVATKRGQLPDIAVSQHIDQYCPQNELIKSRNHKPKSNLQSCNFKSCKQKDLIYMECSDCKFKFCIKHRYPSDHSCRGPIESKLNLNNLNDNWQSFKGSCSQRGSSGLDLIKTKAQEISNSGRAALHRLANSKMVPSSSASGSSTTRGARGRALQGNLTEEEALAIALSNSTKTDGFPPSEDEDADLARAIQQSELEARNNRNITSSNKDTCVLS